MLARLSILRCSRTLYLFGFCVLDVLAFVITRVNTGVDIVCVILVYYLPGIVYKLAVVNLLQANI